MTSKNLWGELPAIEKIRLPVAILREQAGFLGEMTNGILEARVDNRSEGMNFMYDFDVHARVLNNYRITILTATHGDSIYPVDIMDHIGSMRHSCGDENAFIEAIEKILSSEGIRKTITRLLSLSEAEAPPGMFPAPF